jgi:hypothetical protein
LTADVTKLTCRINGLTVSPTQRRSNGRRPGSGAAIGTVLDGFALASARVIAVGELRSNFAEA